VSYESKLVAVAQAEDTWDLSQHIAWTDVIKPRLQKKAENYSKMLVAHLLGQPLPGDLTKEQLAGRIYGIQEIISTFELVLVQGKHALEDIESSGVSLQK
jgi:hypothetical protein